ncbi:exodeoxyribonuclease III [Sarracenia purpurea var. burkii]
MELSLSGNALKTFARSITCLARIGNELAIQASPSQLACHTLNASRSSYQSITFKPDFFDAYTISGTQVQCSVLLKAICSVLRTPLTSVDRLSVLLPDPDSSKVHNFVVRPRDLNRLLGNFQSTLQEITIIATEPSSLPSDVASEIGGKALWIDPTEEFVQYTHRGDPVDVTFGVKELKAFLSFCEGCEVDIHLYLDKAGEPILLAPKFGLDDGSTSNFDATLVLATMLISQLHEGNPSEPPAAAGMMPAQPGYGTGSQAQERTRANASEHPSDDSDHTRIWSEISGSGGKSGNGVEGGRNPNMHEQGDIQRISAMHISKAASSMQNAAETVGQGLSQHHPSNWVDDADEDEDEADEAELCVQSTPQYHEE